MVRSFQSFLKEIGEDTSHSEADQAFCNLLAFWTNNNPSGLDQNFP